MGGGNSAVDAARSALRMGSRVTLAYRRSRLDMPANAEELEGALEEGVELLCMAQPLEILGDAEGKVRAVKVARMKAGPVDSTGRPRPCPRASPASSLREPSSSPRASGSASPAWKSWASSERDGRIKADPITFRTANPKVWAAGDAVTGPATAAEAMGQGQGGLRRHRRGPGRGRALRAPLQEVRLLDGRPQGALLRQGHEDAEAPRRGQAKLRRDLLGYTGEEARIEAERCLRCDVREGARTPLGFAGPACAPKDGAGRLRR